ncbi:hypothetical protein BKA69DRAFT_1050425 [Paraphysoderma sedebokerense]|nr:hypothetical protein BKA69DRAFT_1050425 [Paraphysoderma sedebokerense]
MRFPPAPQPDILRAHQKDVLFLQQYTKSVQDIAGSFLGMKLLILCRGMGLV